jgi:hypothetical protein
MGETTQIEFTQQGYRQLVRAIAAAAGAVTGNGSATSATPPLTPPAADDSGVPQPLPWIRETEGRTLVAFTDGQGLLRWVDRTVLSDVPAGWCPLLVGRPVVRAGR